MDYFKYQDNFSKYKDVDSKLILGEKNFFNRPKITIAITTYKRENLLKEALKSAINQKKFQNYEIIVVDNDPEENGIKELIMNENFNILYYKNEKNIGMFGNMNRAIELSNGEYVTILHDDDWLEENFLESVNKYLISDKAINTFYKINDFRENKIIESSKKIFFKKIYSILKKIKKIREYSLKDYFYSPRGPGALGMVYKRDKMIKLGGYNEEFFPSSDYIFQTRYCLEYGTLLLKKELCNYRIQKNESLKEATVQSFIRDNESFRKYLNKKFLKKMKLEKEIEVLKEWDKKEAINWNIKLDYDFKKKKLKIIIIRLKEYIKNIF